MIGWPILATTIDRLFDAHFPKLHYFLFSLTPISVAKFEPHGPPKVTKLTPRAPPGGENDPPGPTTIFCTIDDDDKRRRRRFDDDDDDDDDLR